MPLGGGIHRISSVIPPEAGIAMMLGAEIGTCADTLVASIGRSREALRVGLFHLGFNIVSVAAGALCIGLLTAFARSTSDDPAQQIASAHIAFNVAGALVFLCFTSSLGILLQWIVPNRRVPAAA